MVSDTVKYDVFLSYARGDDEPFVRRLCDDLTAAGFKVWFDRDDLRSRGLTFLHEIRNAIDACDRLVLIVGPRAAQSEFVRQEWQYAWFDQAEVVTPILRTPRGSEPAEDDYKLIPEELRLLHCEDFRDDRRYATQLPKLLASLRAPPPKLGQLIGVPGLPQHYLSRADLLTELREAVRAGLDSPAPLGGTTAHQKLAGIVGRRRMAGMAGMGGIGKSVLALLLAHDRFVREAFPDGIVWAALGTSPTIVELQRRVHRDLGGDGAFEDVHEGKRQLSELLAEKSVLLILDDAWRRADVEAFDVLGPACRALITTRDAQLVTSLGGTPHLVELLSDDEALRLLAATLGKELSQLPPEVLQLIQQCGRLPLAVALAGGMIAAGQTWANLLKAFERHKLAFFKDSQRDNQHHDLLRAIEVSVEALPTEQQARLIELGVFPEDETVPEAAVACLWQHTGKLDDLDTSALLVDLKQRSLIRLAAPKHDSAVTVGRASLHDLIHDYCLLRAQQQFGSESALHERLLIAYRAKCAGGWWTGPDDGYFFEHLCEHLVQAGRQAEVVSLVKDREWIVAKVRNHNADNLLADLAVADEQCGPDASSSEPLLSELSKALMQELPHLRDYEPHSQLPIESLTIQQLRNRVYRNSMGRTEWPANGGVILGGRLRHLSPKRPTRFRTVIGSRRNLLLYRLQMCLLPSGELMVANGEKAISFIDPERGVVTRTLPCHGRAMSCGMTEDGMTAVVGGDLGSQSETGFLQIIDLRTGTPVVTKEFEFLAARVLIHRPDQFLISDASGQVKRFSLPDLNYLEDWNPHPNAECIALAISHDRRWIATGEYHDAEYGCSIRLWEASTMEVLAEWSGPRWCICDLAFSPDDAYIAAGSIDTGAGLVAWALADVMPSRTDVVPTRQSAEPLVAIETQDSVIGVSWLSGSRTVIGVEGSPLHKSDAINVVDIQENRTALISGAVGVCSAVVADRDGRWFAVLHANGQVSLWPADAAEERISRNRYPTFTGHSVTHDLTGVFSVGENQKLYFTDIHLEKTVLNAKQYASVHGCAWSKSGTYRASTAWMQFPMVDGFVDEEEQARQWRWFVQSVPIGLYLNDKGWSIEPNLSTRQIAVSPDESYAAALFGREEGRGSLLAIRSTTGSDRPAVVELPIGVARFDFAPDGSALVLYDAIETQFGFRPLDGSGAPVQWFPIPDSPSGSTWKLVFGAGCVLLARDRSIDVFRLIGEDPSSPEGIERSASYVHSRIITHLAFDQAGKRLAIADDYPSVNVMEWPGLCATHWAPLEQIAEIHFDSSGHRILAVGNRPGVAGLDYSLLELS